MPEMLTLLLVTSSTSMSLPQRPPFAPPSTRVSPVILLACAFWTWYVTAVLAEYQARPSVSRRVTTELFASICCTPAGICVPVVVVDGAIDGVLFGTKRVEGTASVCCDCALLVWRVCVDGA